MGRVRGRRGGGRDRLSGRAQAGRGGIAHKTERGLVRVGLGDAATVTAEAEALLAAARPEDGEVALLVAEMVRSQRELIAGLVRDPQFGPCVMLGLGGILAEAVGDAVFAMTPLSREEALGMVDGLETADLLTKPHRGEPAIDREALADVLEGLGRLAIDRPDIVSVDLNPLIGLRPVAVDALVEATTSGTPRTPARPCRPSTTTRFASASDRSSTRAGSSSPAWRATPGSSAS